MGRIVCSYLVYRSLINSTIFFHEMLINTAFLRGSYLKNVVLAKLEIKKVAPVVFGGNENGKFSG